ncbi:hypothetical protein RRG08_056395 [Elysia crispata]|uniref:Major facilitator superfamily (MFS) profile domain-containing protein n=1 Tax=Elysia crispata TaxID=231223 RepID=A0AAE1DLM3_9GAST|nr:hypothetical protein RRG08_056395 [Elysia crispata]
MAGLMIGSVTSSGLSWDRFGRKKAFLFLTWVHFVAAFAAAFVPSVFVFLALRMVLTSSCVGFFASACVMSMEVVSSRRRTLAGMVLMFGWSAGMFMLVIAAFLIRDWQTLQLVLVIPLAIVAVTYIWLFPESPRWLLSKGRFSEADAIFKTMAKVNKRELPEKMLMADLCRAESSDSNDDTQLRRKSHQQSADQRSKCPKALSVPSVAPKAAHILKHCGCKISRFFLPFLFPVLIG